MYGRMIATVLLCLIPASASLRGDDSRPQKVALLVGVNRYLKPGFDDLSYSEDDVTAVGEELQKLGFKVTVLTGSAKQEQQRATKANIEKTTRRLVKPLGKRDVMLLMFSGHGQTLNPDPHADPTKIDLDKFQSFYCPVDAVANDPATQVALNYLLDDILAQNVGRKLLILDACRDIPIDRSKGGKNARGIDATRIDLRAGTSVYLSCGFGQRSFEKPELQHGLFTHCLLDGLRGGAARGGELAWADLVAHVNRQMQSEEILKLMPPNEQQLPFPAGDLTHTVLGKLDVPRTPPALAPRPGALDATFGNGGRSNVSFGFGGFEDARAIAIQPDGKLVVAGEVEKALKASAYHFAVARLNPDGSIDTSFDLDGKVTLSFGRFDDGIRGRCLAIQPDGKIICGGRAEKTGWGYEFGLARLLPDGRLDQTFGSNGQVTTDLTRRKPRQALSSELQALALQSDGRIVVAGKTSINLEGAAQPAFGIARYLSSGRLDQSFGNNGWSVNRLSGDTTEVMGMTIQPDGKVVVVGMASGRDGRDAVILRYTRSGTLDNSFDGDGVVYLQVGAGGDDYAYDALVQGDKLLVLVNGEGLKESSVVRFLPDGRLDPTFGPNQNGAARLGCYAVGLSSLPDGRILAVDQRAYAIVTLSADGEIDAVPRAGLTAQATEPRLESPRCLARTSDGRVVVAGSHLTDASGRRSMSVVREFGPDRK
ncbi:MAG: caspase family protein [Planctomycetaceae bacterium]|nr:caspase family protein [Planctomycetaceae bacterium]